jgi:hypothetical protein
MNKPWKRADVASAVMAAGAVCMLVLGAWRFATHPEIFWSLRPLPTAPSAAGTGGGLIVVYQARDCGSYAAFIQRWASVRKPGEFEVVGVPLDADNREPWARLAFEDLAPEYPVRTDLDGKAIGMLAGLRNLRTPAAILVDARGRPRMIIDATSDPRAFARARDLVVSYSSHMQNSSR